MENACCNEGNPNTNLYFSNKENSIQKHNMVIFNLSNLYYKYKNLNKSRIINIDKNTKIVYPAISKQFSTSTIYLAFIKFCKFNSGIILDEQLSNICIRNECDFAKLDSIEKKIQTMKDDGLTYSVNSLNVLLNIVNRKNIINYEIDAAVITEKVLLEKTLSYLKEQAENDLCEPKLLDKLEDIVDRFDIDIKKDEPDTIMDDFERYLQTITEKLSSSIVEKMKEKGRLGRQLQDFILENTKKTRKERFILNWSDRGNKVYMSQEDETGFEIFKLLKEMVINICKIYPNIILNKIDFKKRYVPVHWTKGSRKLSARHVQDIEKFMMKEYANFTGFYDDPDIVSILNIVTVKSANLLQLLESIPFYAGIGSDKKYGSIFDGTIVKRLGYYFLLCALNIYIEASEEVPSIIVGQGEEEEEELGVIEGEKEALQTKVCSLLSVYLGKIRNYKKMLNNNNESINNKVLKAKEKEKEKVKANLKSLTIEEREVENIKKKHSLGEWGLGQTRAIFEYDENQYDKEREKQESDILFEIKKAAEASLDDTTTAEDIAWADEVEKRIAAEVWNLDGLPDDDDFGDRDGDGGDYV